VSARESTKTDLYFVMMFAEWIWMRAVLIYGLRTWIP